MTIVITCTDLWPWGEASQGHCHHPPPGQSSFCQVGAELSSLLLMSPSQSALVNKSWHFFLSKLCQNRKVRNFPGREKVDSHPSQKLETSPSPLVSQNFIDATIFSKASPLHQKLVDHFLHNIDAYIRFCKLAAATFTLEQTSTNPVA